MRRVRDLPRWARALLLALIVVAAIVVIIRVVLDPVATHYTRKALAESDAVRGDLQGVHVTVFPPGYEVRRLKVIEHPGGDWKHPLFYAEEIRVGVDWRALLHRRIAARARIDRPKLVLNKRSEEQVEKVKEKAKEKAKAGIPDVNAALGKVMPAQVTRIEVRGGEVLYRDLNAPRRPEIWIHGLEMAVENVTTRPELARGRPAMVSGQGKLGRSGDLTFFVSADPFHHNPDFAGQFAVRGWKVAELYDLVEPATKLQTPEGTLDLFTEFRSTNGLITGGVKPVLKNVKVRPTEEGLGNKLKAWIADTGLHLFSDRVPDRNAVVTVIPIKGRVQDPNVQVWPTVLGVIRNAFVEGISSGFAHLPPATAEKEQGKLEQVKNALKKDKGPPKAQPAPQEEKK
jgi:hypothetical protein